MGREASGYTALVIRRRALLLLIAVLGMPVFLSLLAAEESASRDWYLPFEIEREDFGDKPPPIGLVQIRLEAEGPLLGEGEDLESVVPLGDGKVVALLVRADTEPGGRRFLVRFADVEKQETLAEHPWPWPTSNFETAALCFDGHPNWGICAAGEDLLLWGQNHVGRMNVSTGAVEVLLEVPGDRAIAPLGAPPFGRLPDGRFFVASVKRQALGGGEEGEDLAAEAARFGAQLHRFAPGAPSSGAASQEIADLLGAWFPMGIAPGGLLLAMEVPGSGKSNLVAIDGAAGRVRWRREFELTPIPEGVAGDRILILPFSFGESWRDLPLGDHVSLDLVTGAPRYSLPVRVTTLGHSPRFLLSTDRVDIYREEAPDDTRIVFAVDARDGRRLWSAETEMSLDHPIVVYDASTDVVVLLDEGSDYGVRFEATTGRQTAAIALDRDVTALRQSGGAWMSDDAFLRATETVPVTRAHVQGASPWNDEEGVLVIPDSEEALALLLVALKDPRVEYRRGAAEDLRDFSLPGEAGPALEPLTVALSDADIEVRRLTAEALGDLWSSVESNPVGLPLPRAAATERLLRALEDPAPSVGDEAAIALGIIDPDSPAAGERLRIVIGSGERELHPRALLALLGMAEPYCSIGAETFVRDLESPDAERRMHAAAVGQGVARGHRRFHGLQKVLGALLKGSLEHADESTAFQCRESLRDMGTAAAAARPALRLAYAEPAHAERKVSILVTLCAIGAEPEDLPVLVEALDRVEEGAKYPVGKAIGTLGAGGAAALIRMLDHADPAVQAAAVGGLAEAGEHAGPAVGKLLDRMRRFHETEPGEVGGNQQRRGVMYVFERLGPVAAEAVPALVEHVRGGEGMDADSALRALCTMGEAAAPAVPLMADRLRSENRYERWLGIRCLGTLGPIARDALPALREARDNDPDEELRQVAAVAVRRLEGGE